MLTCRSYNCEEHICKVSWYLCIFDILRSVTGPLLHGVLAFVCCLGSTASIVNVRFKYTIIYNIRCPLKDLPITVVESPKIQCSLYGILNVVGRLCPCIGPGCRRCGLIWMWLDFIAHSSHTVLFTTRVVIMRIFACNSVIHRVQEKTPLCLKTISLVSLIGFW